MNRFFTFLLLTLSLSIYSQSPAPKLINYQGVARDPAGAPITTAIDIRFVIKDLSNTVHDETQTNIQPNQHGIFSTQIGLAPTLTVTNWTNGPYMLDIHIKTGSAFVFVGTQQLVSVPFSLFANNVPTSYTNNILTIGNNSYSISSSTAVTPTINGTGLVTVTPNTGPVYTIDVPPPSLSYASAGNILTLTQGTVVSAVPLTGTGSSTVAMTGAGVASVNPTGGSAFTVTVPPPTISSTGNIISITQGSASSSTTFSPTLSGDVTGGLATTTVASLQSAPLSSLYPINGQVLTFTGGTWTPVTPAVGPVSPWQKIGSNVSLITITDNVGIGVATPGAKLDVTGTATTAAAIVKATNINTSSTFPAIQASSNGGPAVSGTETSLTGANAGEFSSNNGTGVFAASTASNGSSPAVLANSTNSNVNNYAGIFNGGLVAKGKTITSAGYALNVQNVASTSILVARNDGYVGIGDAFPSTKLHVSGVNNITIPNGFSASPETAIRVHNDDQTNNNFSSLIFSTRASNSSLFEGGKIACIYTDHTNVTGDLVFFTRSPGNLFERMRITGAGLVGIGTNTPSTPLDVIGKTSTDSLQVTTPVAPVVGSILLARDATGNTKWSPGQIAFQFNFAPSAAITLTTNTVNNLGNNIQFSGASSVSMGGGFNTTTAQFTAPVAGLYSFDGSLEVSLNPAASGNNWIYLEICKNPASPVILKRSLLNNTDGTLFTYSVLQASTLANLAAGDVIFLRAVGNSGGSGGSITTNNSPNFINSFSGYLIR